MRERPSFESQISVIDSSYGPEEEWSGTIQLDGCRARFWLEPEGWLSASVPLPGSPEELLRKQAELIGPAKTASGATLRAEMPVDKDQEIGESFIVVRRALKQGLSVLTKNDSRRDEIPHGVAEVAIGLGDVSSLSSQEWTPEGEGLALRVEAGMFSQKIVMESVDGCVRVRADLVRLREPDSASVKALVHFLLALNARLRMARALLLPERVSLEVILTKEGIRRRLIDRAVSALTIGVRMGRRECAALLEADVARAYNEFHQERR